MASVAVFIALGGGAYAAVSLPKNSVGTKQIKKNAVTAQKIKSNSVTSAKIAKNAVTGAKVKNGSLTGADINLSTLPKVGSAASADNAAHAAAADKATNADHATNADSATTAASADKATIADNIAPPEAWHEVGAPGEPAFATNAANYPSGTTQFDFEKVGFYKDKEGVVHLRGVAKTGDGGFIFALPQGYRPAAKKIVVLGANCPSCSAPATPIFIVGPGIDPSLPDGSVVLVSGGADQSVVLEGLSFRPPA